MTGLTGTTLTDWITLRRVSGSGVAVIHGAVVEDGQQVPAYLVASLIDLVRDQHVTLGLPDEWGVRRMNLTERGHARFIELDRHHANGDVSPQTSFDAG